MHEFETRTREESAYRHVLAILVFNDVVFRVVVVSSTNNTMVAFISQLVRISIFTMSSWSKIKSEEGGLVLNRTHQASGSVPINLFPSAST